MKYCSQCGAETRIAIPPGEVLPRHVCAACHTIHYQNPKVVAGCRATSCNTRRRIGWGRVISLYVTMSLGMTIFGSLLAGGGATYFGAPLTVTIGGLVTILSAAAYYRTLPGIRRHIREHGLFAPAEIATP